MSSLKANVFIILQLQLIFQPSNQMSFRPKYFKVEKAASCPLASNHGGSLAKFEMTQTNKYHFHIDADINFIQNVSDPIQFQLRYYKCTLENLGATCDHPELWKIDDICEHLKQRNALWTPLMNIIKPKLVCPIKKGTYSIRNGTVDLSIFSRLPIDGFRYKTTISFYKLAKDVKPLQLVCLESDVIVTASGNKERPRHRTANPKPLL